MIYGLSTSQPEDHRLKPWLTPLEFLGIHVQNLILNFAPNFIVMEKIVRKSAKPYEAIQWCVQSSQFTLGLHENYRLSPLVLEGGLYPHTHKYIC